MSDQQTNNKRIAKNTLLLYFRMILIMLVSLYTSRLILKELGVEDFGIYNLVAGVVVLFSFLSNSMVTATQRYLSVAIGQCDKSSIQNVFSASLVSHIGLLLLVLVFAETIGLWFVNTQLDIPNNRMCATNYVYQLAILTTCFNIIRVPYNASIIANERMNFFAYTSILESVLKLLIVWVLSVAVSDKLIVYSLLLLLVTIFTNWIFYYYCTAKLVANKFIIRADKKTLLELTAFSGWSLFGGLADVGYKQGTSVLLNIFFGVSINAAFGITNQVRNAVFSFVANLQIAANPQIIKSFAASNYDYFKSLIFRISKYSYFLMLILVAPIIFNIELILSIWLTNPPPYTYDFVVLILIFTLVDSLSGPQWVAMQASGKIKLFQVITSLCLLLNLPISFMLLNCNYGPNSVLLTQILICCLTLIIRLLFLKYKLNISIMEYFINVVQKIIFVTILALPVPYYIYITTEDYERLFLSFFTVPLTMFLIYIVGTTYNERLMIKQIFKTKILSRFI